MVACLILRLRPTTEIFEPVLQSSQPCELTSLLASLLIDPVPSSSQPCELASLLASPRQDLHVSTPPVVQPLRPTALHVANRAYEALMRAHDASDDVICMVELMVAEMLSDTGLLWWANVSPPSTVRDLCAFVELAWCSKMMHEVYLILKAAVSTITCIGREANLLNGYRDSRCSVSSVSMWNRIALATWQYILNDVEVAEARLTDADILLFDIWEAIPYYRIDKEPELVEKIVEAAWSMCTYGERHAIGLLQKGNSHHDRVSTALAKYSFTVHSLDSMPSLDDAQYLDEVMFELVRKFYRRKSCKKALTLFSGGAPERRPALINAIRNALLKGVWVILAAWHNNLNTVYRDFAMNTLLAPGDLRIMAIDDLTTGKWVPDECVGAQACGWSSV